MDHNFFLFISLIIYLMCVCIYFFVCRFFIFFDHFFFCYCYSICQRNRVNWKFVEIYYADLMLFFCELCFFPRHFFLLLLLKCQSNLHFTVSSKKKTTTTTWNEKLSCFFFGQTHKYKNAIAELLSSLAYCKSQCVKSLTNENELNLFVHFRFFSHKHACNFFPFEFNKKEKKLYIHRLKRPPLHGMAMSHYFNI